MKSELTRARRPSLNGAVAPYLGAVCEQVTRSQNVSRRLRSSSAATSAAAAAGSPLVLGPRWGVHVVLHIKHNLLVVERVASSPSNLRWAA